MLFFNKIHIYKLIFLLFAFLIFSCNKNNKLDSSNTDFSLKVDSIMSLMTLKEKIGQMTLYSGDWDKTGPVISTNNIKFLRKEALVRCLMYTQQRKQENYKRLLLKKQDLVFHFYLDMMLFMVLKQYFQLIWGHASSWDLEDIQKSARIAATEATSEGLNWTFAPMLDIARDPRWGRVSEGSGEDVFLTSQIAKDM